jgi:hypothetical protein
MNNSTTTRYQLSQYTCLHSYYARLIDNSISRGLPRRENQNRCPKMKVCNIVTNYMAVGNLKTKKRKSRGLCHGVQKCVQGKAKGRRNV